MAVVNVINSKAQKVSQIDLVDTIFNIPVKGSVLHEVLRP
jgi:large subunit ribosomal protein L4